MAADGENSCPLCGGDNQCAIASGKLASECWCRSVTMDSGAMRCLPAEEVGKRCICRACSTTLGENVSEGQCS